MRKNESCGQAVGAADSGALVHRAGAAAIGPWANNRPAYRLLTLRSRNSTTAGHNFSTDEITGVVRALEVLFVVEQGEALAIKDRRLPPEWYVGERRRPGGFMTRYLQKLTEDGWPPRSVRARAVNRRSGRGR